MRIHACLIVAAFLGGCTSVGPVPDLETPLPTLDPRPPTGDENETATGEVWHGTIGEGPEVVLTLSSERGSDGSLRSILQGPAPVQSIFDFIADAPSRGWPAGTPLSGGVSIEFHSPVLEDLVVMLAAEGEPVARATFVAPLQRTPIDEPVLYHLPALTEAEIPAGAILTLVAQVGSTVDLTLHASAAHPSGITLGSPQTANPPANTAAIQRIMIERGGHLPPCAGSPDTNAMPPCEWVVGSQRWFREEVPATVVGANLTLSWTPVSPLTETLFLGFGPVTTEGETDTFTAEAQSTKGTSPLTLTLEGLNWDAERYAISVWWSGATAGGPEQPFSIDGEMRRLGSGP